MPNNIGNHPENLEFQNTMWTDHSVHRQLPHTECLIQPCGGCSELAEAEAQVAIAQNLLDIARKRLAKAKTNLNHWHDRLVARLPPEIISEIFLFRSCYDYGPKQHFNFSTSLLLASVCQRWRGIALATPQLWTGVDIEIWKHAARLEITQDLLLRSRSLPLDLTFYDGGLAPNEWSISLDRILNIIRSHSIRWQYLNFANVYRHIETHATALLHKLFDNLEAMPISDRFELRLADVGCPRPIFLPEPLRPTVFHSWATDHGTNIPLRWDHLTHFDVDSFSVSSILAIVCQAPRLLELTSNNALHLEGQALPFPINPTIHRCLTVLNLIGSNSNDILRRLTLPSLQYFNCYAGRGDDYDVVLGDLIHFLDRSDLKPGSLQKFHLHLQYDDIQVGEEDSHRFVELAAITDLELCCDGSNHSTLLYSYLCKLSEPSVFPHLRHLGVRVGYMISAASWALLSDLCHGRSLEETTSDQSTADETSSSEVYPTSISLPGTLAQRYKLPLESLSVARCAMPDTPTMEKHVLLRFLEAQRAGVKIEVWDMHGDDVLKTLAGLYGC